MNRDLQRIILMVLIFGIFLSLSIPHSLSMDIGLYKGADGAGIFFPGIWCQLVLPC